MTTKATWSVVAIYENPENREAAMAFCDRLTQRFWADFDFDVSWWSFDLLQTEPSAKLAMEKAASADLTLFATRSEGDLPRHVSNWIESWLSQRGEREGTLVGLLDTEEDQSRGTTGKHFYFRNLAHRSGLDYLTQVPQCISHPIPESIESYAERAQQVTGVLDEILHQPPPPPAPR